MDFDGTKYLQMFNRRVSKGVVKILTRELNISK